MLERERKDKNGTHNGVSNLSLGHMAVSWKPLPPHSFRVERAGTEKGEYGERERMRNLKYLREERKYMV